TRPAGVSLRAVDRRGGAGSANSVRVDMESERCMDLLRQTFIFIRVRAVEQDEPDEVAVVFERFDPVTRLLDQGDGKDLGHMIPKFGGRAEVDQGATGGAAENQRTGAAALLHAGRQMGTFAQRQVNG